MDKIEMLKRNCDGDRPHMANPFVVDVDGEKWTAATDGYMLLAFAGVIDEVFDAPSRTQKMSSMMASVSGLLANARRASRVLDLASLQRAVGAPVFPRTETCSVCDGSGHACSCGECECEHCVEGSVHHGALPRKGYLLDRLCDFNRVACLLDGLSGPAFIEASGDLPLFFAGAGWLAVLMPVDARWESDAELVSYPRWGGTDGLLSHVARTQGA